MSFCWDPAHLEEPSSTANGPKSPRPRASVPVVWVASGRRRRRSQTQRLRDGEHVGGLCSRAASGPRQVLPSGASTESPAAPFSRCERVCFPPVSERRDLHARRQQFHLPVPGRLRGTHL